MSLAFKRKTLNEEVSLKIAHGRVKLKHFSFLLCPLLCVMHKVIFNDFWTTGHEKNKFYLKQGNRASKCYPDFCLGLYLLLFLFPVAYSLYCIIFHPILLDICFLKGSLYYLLFYGYIQEDNIIKISDIFSDLCRNGHVKRLWLKEPCFFHLIWVFSQFTDFFNKQ